MELIPYKNNAKLHDAKQIELIASSLKRWGWRQPILVNKNGVIIAGHGRYLAFQHYPSEIKTPWVVDENGNTIYGTAEINPFQSEEEEKAYRLADNQINAITGFDMKLVVEELKDLDLTLIDLTGFSRDLVIEDEDKDDDVPAIPVEPQTKRGDVYILGTSRVMCGDSTDQHDVAKLMNGQKADMVFTDPPYNVNYKGQGSETTNTILNDNMSKSDFDIFLEKTFERYAEVSKKGAGWYVFHSSSTQHQFQSAIEKTGWKVKNQIIWNKPMAALGWGDYRWKHEPMFYCGNEDTQFYGDRTHSTVIAIPEDHEKALKWLIKQQELDKMGYTTVWSMKREPVAGYKHPTQKPVELITYAIFNSSKQGDNVVDLFLGSGSTLIASEKSHRSCYSMELDERYVDVAVQRWVEYTGINTVIKNNQEIQWLDQ